MPHNVECLRIWFPNCGSVKGDLDLTEKSIFFRQINVFTKEVTKELVSRNYLSMIMFYVAFHELSIFQEKVYLLFFFHIV